MKKFENYCSHLNILSRAGQEDLTNEFISMTHIYDGAEAQKLVHIILEQYIPEFIRLRDNLQEQYPLL